MIGLLNNGNKLDIKDVSFSWNSSNTAIFEKFSLQIDPSQVTAILGKSGCGKTTLLRLLAGLNRPTSGHILSSGSEIISPSPDRTLLFQEYALFEWMTVRENIQVAIEFAQRPNTSENDISQILDLVGLGQAASLYPNELSGGMQQRAALARAIAVRPKLILLDEPFSALDIHTRQNIQAEVARILENMNSGAVLVTHYVEEAVFLADRVIVLGGAPAKIVLDLSVDLARPRARDLIGTSAFQQTSAIVHQSLEK